MLYNNALYFLVYSFIGWCGEVAYHALKERSFANRGMLNGPVCPIYGIGVLLLVNLLAPLSGHLGLLFIGAMLLMSLEELIGGWALDKLFHQRWWDYSDTPLNLGGYICLGFSLLWGVAGVLLLRVVHPPIAFLLSRILPRAGWFILIPLYVIFTVDLVTTILILLKLNRRLAQLDEIRHSIREVSDRIGLIVNNSTLKVVDQLEGNEQLGHLKTNVGEVSQTLSEKGQQVALSLDQKRQQVTQSLGETKQSVERGLGGIRQAASGTRQNMEQGINELRSRLNELTRKEESLTRTKPSYGIRRLLKAFPGARSTRYSETLEALKHALLSRVSADPDTHHDPD
ncbi:MAG: hypothetical protein PHR21_05295 [Oscillospiraceae bacterium]|nr:hypothetical protein [Oscillospiraceae bacterium]MDD4367422.1 hypothetical protein [Oscillospiraceae bacterium]